MRTRTLKVLMSLVVVTLMGLLPAATAHAAGPTVTRISGADRYETAALVSKGSFAPNVPVAFIATGDNFPDALAAAAASAQAKGPVLLVHQGSLPQSTKDELTRLAPQNIVVVGGVNAVSQAVFDQLDAFTTGSVGRVQGADRYATAATLSKSFFPSPTNTVFIATGQNFPDALSAGPAAAQEGSPVLLVPGTGPLPQPVVNELNRVQVSQLVVLGGLNVISHDVLVQLRSFVSSDDQMLVDAGADRFTTSELISEAFFSSSDKVLFATGRNYPDALAAGGPAGIAHAPMLLVDSSCVPPQINSEIPRLGAKSIVVVGGPAAVGQGVLSRTICTGGQPGHFSFGEGDVLVGAQGVPAGTYRTRSGTDGCVWARFSGPDLNNDILTANITLHPEVVTLKPSDYQFSSQGCAIWTDDLSPITSSPTAPFGDGNYIVGSDIAAGTWHTDGSADCYWQRESGFGNEDADFIDDNGATGDQVTNVTVTIAPTDKGFYSDSCGTWTKVG
jgi:putative cell wall-binding protein